ncbi:hypothetical protein B0A54_07092 [Friedmanniomyces endolithicus]|uniref:Berberine/berberine-like domain-containing protein n=1 Tax=Friedmanniomyces endolithicus TaxID=329885 RepID=A0A4U0V4X3_9PEZI|nr:hypothetical protein B0A54_07092 [Friedmanniomyces endolithicus]
MAVVIEQRMYNVAALVISLMILEPPSSLHPNRYAISKCFSRPASRAWHGPDVLSRSDFLPGYGEDLSANIDQGITIDLSALNQVTPSKDLSSIVLASGLTINVTQTSFPDLWVALKGGSNNFGIVTAFESTAFPQGKFWGGFIGNPGSTKDAQFKAFEEFTGSPNYDPYAALINSYVFTAATNSWFIANNLEYTKNQTYPPYFQNFTSLPQIFNTMRISNLTDFTLELAASNPDGRRQLFVTGTYANSAKMMSEIFNIANSTVQALIPVPGISYSLSFQPEPTIITSKAASRGGNSLGLTAADGNLFNLLLTVSWDSAAYDARIDTQAKALFDQAETYAKANGFYNEYLYLNYAAPWQKPIAGYGAANVANLMAVSRKYDPLQVFQKQVPGGFKLDQ